MTGLYCQASRNVVPVGSDPTPSRVFDTREPCWASGLWLEAGARYEVTLTADGDWIDGFHYRGTECQEGDACLRADLLGLRKDEAIHGVSGHDRLPWALPLAVPERRLLCQPWFKPIAQVGTSAWELHPLDPIEPTTRPVRVLKSKLVARKNGELFLFVNDGVLVSPNLPCEFYSNNRGTARVEVRRVD